MLTEDSVTSVYISCILIELLVLNILQKHCRILASRILALEMNSLKWKLNGVKDFGTRDELMEMKIKSCVVV